VFHPLGVLAQGRIERVAPLGIGLLMYDKHVEAGGVEEIDATRFVSVQPASIVVGIDF
jgi:hypothetical protein